MKRGFTLIEMLVVIGIIGVITGAAIAGYERITKTAEKTRAHELVSNVATALSAMYQREGMWPKRVAAAAEGDNRLDEDAAFPLAKKGYMTLDMDSDRTKLDGYDRFGIVTPWAVAVIKKRGKSVQRNATVGSSKKTIEDHTLRFAVDLDGDGFTELPEIEGYSGSKKVRAVVCVWSCAKNGSLAYRDIIKSWSDGQVAE